MPEGHTIHRLARDHRRDFLGQKLKVSSPQGRFADGAKKLSGRELKSIDAWGKHLFYNWGRNTLHIHLGLYGKFRRHKLPAKEPRGQVRLRVIGNEYVLDLNGPNCCELLTAEQTAAITNRLGQDPLRSDADPDVVWKRVSKSRAAVGTLLLNQSVIAGVGNVYRAEILFLHGIHPETQGRQLSRSEFDAIWQTTCELLKIGVKYNRIIITDPDEVGKPRSRMNRQERLLVYKKDACRRCETPIESWLVGNRKIYACPVCQPIRED